MTQEEAANACNLPLRTFQSYDRGEREPPASKMDHIRSVLGSDEEDALAEGNTPASADHRAYEIPVPHPVGDRQTLVVDRREAERQYGDALGKVRAHRVRSSSMEGVVDRGAWVEYVTDTGYQGPGMYLLSLTGERPWPAYIPKLSPVEMEIDTTNREAPIRLVREGPDAEWAHEDGGEVDFVLHGICERWDRDTVDL